LASFPIRIKKVKIHDNRKEDERVDVSTSPSSCNYKYHAGVLFTNYISENPVSYQHVFSINTRI